MAAQSVQFVSPGADPMSPMFDHDVADLSRADEGHKRIAWAAREMPVLKLIETRFQAEQPSVGFFLLPVPLTFLRARGKATPHRQPARSQLGLRLPAPRH